MGWVCGAADKLFVLFAVIWVIGYTATHPNAGVEPPVKRTYTLEERNHRLATECRTISHPIKGLIDSEGCKK